MEHPQTTAIELHKAGFQLPYLKEIGESGCCAFTFIWWAGVECSDIEAIRIVSDAIVAGVIEKDCTVKWLEIGAWLTGRNLDVDFVRIKDLFGINGKTPVMYKYKGNAHWVGVEKGMIKFNSLKHSNVVEHGLPVEKRVICIKGLVK